MPIEIRQITIKTEVKTNTFDHASEKSVKDLQRMKEQILLDCKRMIQGKIKRNNSKR